MNGGKVAPAKQDIELMYAVGVNHGERTRTSLCTRTRVSRVVAQLDSLSKASQAHALEEHTGPFL